MCKRMHEEGMTPITTLTNAVQLANHARKNNYTHKDRQDWFCSACPQSLGTACRRSRKKYFQASEMKSQSAVRSERSFETVI